ncbi:MAG TPA: hypothetical protein VIW48_01510 [Nitrospiraceae bacterium]
MDAEDPQFQHFLRLAAAGPHLYQIGLSGSAYTALNVVAVGPAWFQDDGGDHIHLGTRS